MAARTDGIQPIVIRGTDGINEAVVSATGRLLVSHQLFSFPTNSVPVIISEYSNVSGSIDTPYTITNGKTLFIQRLVAGAANDSVNGNVVELYEDPNGNLSVLNIIDVIFVSGNSDSHDLSVTFVGDGIRRIILRRRRLSAGGRLIFGKWEGYEI